MASSAGAWGERRAPRTVDLYDPNTGAIRNASADEIACWFIDTDYDQQCFIVRHAYFTGADEPFEKLQRALKAEIHAAAWQSLYRTTSRPFDPPKSSHNGYWISASKSPRSIPRTFIDGIPTVSGRRYA